jgi:hypothetical protein
MPPTFLTDSSEWMPLVRIKLGVDAIELPDATLNNSILVEMAEKRVKKNMPNWLMHFASNPANIKMATICFLAAQWCDYCETVIMALEYEGPYRSERQRIDWQGKKVELAGEAIGILHDLDPSVELYPVESVMIVSPATPLYQPT